MRVAAIGTRLCVVREDDAVDVERASGGAFSADPQLAFARWDELQRWWAANEATLPASSLIDFGPSDLGPPVPAPRQVFAIGLNYRDHAAEAGLDLPEGNPVVFAKFPASITGPHATVELPSDAVDFEAELVVVIGSGGYRLSRDDAWSRSRRPDPRPGPVGAARPVARTLTAVLAGQVLPRLLPIGPVVATPDEFPDLDDIALGCSLNGRTMQRGSSRDMVFAVPELVSSCQRSSRCSPGTSSSPAHRPASAGPATPGSSCRPATGSSPPPTSSAR